MANWSPSLCPLCDDDRLLDSHCSNCQQSMCFSCYSSHKTMCIGDDSAYYSKGGQPTCGEYIGRHASAPRFSSHGDDSQNDLRTRLDELSAHIEEMVIKYNAVEIKASALQDENRSLRQDLRSAHDNNAKLLLDFREMQRDHSTLQTELRAMRREMDQVRDKNFALSEDVATLKAEMAKTTSRVAFHARLSNHLTASGTMVIICPDVVTNIGGGYDPQTGIFTAPLAGLYIFMATASSNSAGNIFYIDLDNTNISSPYTNASNGSTTCHVTVQLNVGQNVCMKAYGGYYFQGTAQQSWTSFSGMLVKPEL